MNISTLIRPVAAVSFSLLTTATVKQELLRPVAFPGQAVQQSPDAYATSLLGHHIGLLSRQLQDFGLLPDNWDGYGAVAPSRAAVGNVLDLLTRLPGEWALRLHTDSLTPSPYGTIALEWEHGQAYLSVEVGDAAWSFTADMAGQSQFASPVHYPNHELWQRVTDLLAHLYPDAAPHNAPAYTA